MPEPKDATPDESLAAQLRPEEAERERMIAEAADPEEEIALILRDLVDPPEALQRWRRQRQQRGEQRPRWEEGLPFDWILVAVGSGIVGNLSYDLLKLAARRAFRGLPPAIPHEQRPRDARPCG